MPSEESARDAEPLAADEEAFVRAFARAMVVVPRLFDTDLQREEHLSLSDYTVLMYLSESVDHRLRMSDLATTCSLSLSGMTRIVDRLAQQGWVTRERSSSDGRGWNAVLTDAGLARIRSAWSSHLRSVRRHVVDHVTDLDLPTLTAALQRFVQADRCDDHSTTSHSFPA